MCGGLPQGFHSHYFSTAPQKHCWKNRVVQPQSRLLVARFDDHLWHTAAVQVGIEEEVDVADKPS